MKPSAVTGSWGETKGDGTSIVKNQLSVLLFKHERVNNFSPAPEKF